MKRYKVYLQSGTVITVQADQIYENSSKWLTFSNGDNSKEEGSYYIVAVFAPGMWEGYQLLQQYNKEPEKSGS